MANIESYLARIRTEIYGEEIRDAIAGALETLNGSGTIEDVVQALNNRNLELKEELRLQGIKDTYLEELATQAKRKNTSQDLRLDALESNQNEVLQAVNQSRLTSNRALDQAETNSDRLNDLDSIIEMMQQVLSEKADDLEVDEEGLVYLMSDGQIIKGPFGPFAGGGSGGGGGTAGNNAVLTLRNASGFSTKTIADGSSCPFEIQWSSMEGDLSTGQGTCRIIVNGATKQSGLNIEQGTVTIDLAPYVSAGANSVRLTVFDTYGNSKTLVVNIKVVALSLTSTFDSSQIFDGGIAFTYIPTGAAEKTIHFILDGEEVGTTTVTTSGRQQTFYLPQQTHGSHTLEAYFTAELDGQVIESNRLFYDLICVRPGAYDPVIAVDLSSQTVSQYSTIVVPFTVYNPETLTSPVTITINGASAAQMTVDRSRQTWSYRADTTGELVITLTSGTASKTITLTVMPVDISAVAETADLALYLSSRGRSNAENNPGTWTYGDIGCDFKNFNFISDGWQQDEDGNTVCRVSGEAELEIDYMPYATDCRTTGKTVEIDFRTRDVRDYDAVVISCMSGGRGFQLTATQAIQASAQSRVVMQYREEDHIRIGFVTEKRNENRLVYLYVDGCRCGVVQYPANDDFSQAEPVKITVGSPDCAVDLYTIRIYNNNLTRYQMLSNWIADSVNGSDMLERFGRNNVYDEYGKIAIEKIPANLPYMIVQMPKLPTFKGDKKTGSETFTDRTSSLKSYNSSNVELDVQGTSSQGYPRKNFKSKHKGGFEINGNHYEVFGIYDRDMPVAVFCYKKDFASCEGANNILMARHYSDIAHYKTPPQRLDSRVRQGINGRPMVLFHDDGQDMTFVGKYNYNNDKSTSELFGFGPGDECWETLNNTSNACLMLEWSDDWQDNYESRYPDGSTDVSRLQSMVETVASWDDQTTRAEVESLFEVQSAIDMFTYCDAHTMVDSLAKNAFPTYFADSGKWCWLPYDMDTCLGINNEGLLVFGYNLEFGDDLEDGSHVFNGHAHKFWNTIKRLYQPEIAACYEDWRSSGKISYATVSKMFEDHQAVWPEAIFNEDSQFCYIDPLIQDGNGSYLSMLQGPKKSQRNWWLFHRYRYLDSKYNCADSKTEQATFRLYAKSNLAITMTDDCYINVKFGSVQTSVRADRNTEYTIINPLDTVNDTETYIGLAGSVKAISGLPASQVGFADISKMVKLEEIAFGQSGEYRNERLTELSVGNLRLLKRIDCTNCVNFGTGSQTTLDLSSCANIEEIYMDGTALTGVELPNGGMITTLHLPATVTNLTIRNQRKLEEFVMPSYANITTLWLENNSAEVDVLDILDQIADNARVRVIGLNLEMDTAEDVLAFMDGLDRFRGLDESGNNMETAQVSGRIHIPAATGAQMAEMLEHYPYINVVADHTSAILTYMSEDGQTVLHTETVLDGGNGTWTGTASKTSTAQYSYTFDGWSRSVGGSLSTDAKNAVTADRSIYAHFTATIRTYSVTFKNGSTTLCTVNGVPYGGTAAYTGPATNTLTDPNGTGQPFQAWVPSPSGIVGNTTCYATYVSPVEIAEIQDSWEQIIENVQNGTYSTVYKLGNYKPLDLGSEGVINMEIVAFDKDIKEDGTTAPISWLSKELLATSKRWNPEIQYVYDYPEKPSWGSSGNTWTTKNRYRISQASGTWVLTATEAGTIGISYKTSDANTTRNKLSLAVNGTSVVTDYASTTSAIYEVTVEAGDTVTVSAVYDLLLANSYYATLVFSGNFTTVATIADAETRETVGYVEGTGTCGTWEKSELRSYYLNTLMPLIPANVRTAIEPVQKEVDGYGTDMQQIRYNIIDPVWCPSYKEMFSSISSGGIYRNRFDKASDRIKSKVGGSALSWWLRSYNGYNSANCVYSSGYDSNSYVYTVWALALGFCF